MEYSRDEVNAETLGEILAFFYVAFVETFNFPPNTLILLDNVSFHHSKVFNEFALTKCWKMQNCRK